MQAAGRTEPSFEAYIYVGGTHSPFTLENSFTRASEFVSRLLEQ
jgi:hypothetical protein